MSLIDYDAELWAFSQDASYIVAEAHRRLSNWSAGAIEAERIRRLLLRPTFAVGEIIPSPVSFGGMLHVDANGNPFYRHIPIKITPSEPAQVC